MQKRKSIKIDDSKLGDSSRGRFEKQKRNKCEFQDFRVERLDRIE